MGLGPRFPNYVGVERFHEYKIIVVGSDFDVVKWLRFGAAAQY